MTTGLSSTERTNTQAGEFADGKFWFERRGSTVTVGLTNSAIEEIGDVESVDFPSEGEDYGKGEVIVTVEGSRGSIEVIAPATGVVESVNENVSDELETLAEDPLEEGWLIKFEVQDPTELAESEDESGASGAFPDEEDLAEEDSYEESEEESE